MARVLLLVKLLAAATTISAELSDPCAQAFKEHSNAAGEIFFKAPLDAAVECFRNVSIDSDLRFVRDGTCVQTNTSLVLAHSYCCAQGYPRSAEQSDR
jgi:hypothetical protein